MSTRRTPHATDPSQDYRDRGAEVVRVKLLGGFSVSVGSRTIRQDEWRSKKAVTLVKLLALAPGHRMHRERAIDLLWPDSARSRASNNLRQVLHAARRVLDPSSGSRERYLGLKDEQLFLCPEGQLWVDVKAFEDAAASAQRTKDPAVPRAAIELYAGDFLPEDRYEEWAEGKRIEFRQLYLALLLELAGLYQERDEHSLAIEALRKATAADPTLEEAHASLMQVYALSGRPESALAQYERFRDVVSKELGVGPSTATRALRDEIAAGRSPSAPRTGPVQDVSSEAFEHNLPAPMTSFVGRERETVEVKRMLAMTRLLTLTGTGGTGKTRLALEVAWEVVGSYLGAVWLVELAPISEPGLVAQEVANVLGVQEHPGEPLTDTLAKALASKEMLLVLDNCEHVVEEVARLVDKLLYSCPRLKVLATSREPLGIAGEVNWAIPTLSLPAEGDEESIAESTMDSLMRSDALRLFVDRARLRLPSFELTRQNAGAVARVCQKLDGIPLAIELATARMGALAVEQVAQRLDDSLDVLSGGSRTAPPRQRTLRATLDWSHELLSHAERKAFCLLSAFAGGWTLEAAETVCPEGSVEQGDVLELLGELIDKSLVLAGATTGGALRYRMLEPIRQYATEKLEQSEEAAGVRDRHAAFFLALAEEAAPDLEGSRHGVWSDRLEREHDNLRATLSWFLTRRRPEPAVRTGAALWRFWFTRGYLSEGTGWLERVLAEGGHEPSPARVKALEGLGWLLQYQGEYARARATYERMLELSRASDDKGNETTALNSLGTVAIQQGDSERAKVYLQDNLEALEELEKEGNIATPLKRFHALNLLGYLAITEEGDYARGATLWEESLALAREARDTERIRSTLSNLGYAEVLQGDYEKARASCEEALALAQELGGAGAPIVASTLVNLGLAALGQGDYERASQLFGEALVIGRSAGRKPQMIDTLEGMASLAGATRDATRAACLWGAAEAAREATGIALSPSERAMHEPYLAPARSRLGETAWEDALGEGRAMSLEGAADYVLSEEADQPKATIVREPAAHAELLDYLTHREREITLLVAEGLTNRQISARLSISERTAGNHVARILKKLGLRSRIQIASWTTETKLPASPRPD